MPVSCIEHGIISARAAADDIEARRPCVDIQACHSKRVVVIPVGGCSVVVGVLERCKSRAPSTPNFASALFAKNGYQVPTVANPVGMLFAAGRYHASE